MTFAFYKLNRKCFAICNMINLIAVLAWNYSLLLIKTQKINNSHIFNEKCDWNKLSKNGPSKICEIQPSKNLNWKQTISLKKRLYSTNVTLSILEYSVTLYGTKLSDMVFWLRNIQLKSSKIILKLKYRPKKRRFVKLLFIKVFFWYVY